jgi:hypothetical protein
VNENVHARAGQLVAKDRVEGLSPEERQWLSAHLHECATCAENASATAQALRALRALSVPLPRELARRTQFLVRLRAQQQQAREPRWRTVWIVSGVSWAFGAATAPYVWRGLEWMGHRLGVPNLVWQMGFGVWWALPAIFAAAILLIENTGSAGERQWTRQP